MAGREELAAHGVKVHAAGGRVAAGWPALRTVLRGQRLCGRGCRAHAQQRVLTLHRYGCRVRARQPDTSTPAAPVAVELQGCRHITNATGAGSCCAACAASSGSGMQR